MTGLTSSKRTGIIRGPLKFVLRMEAEHKLRRHVAQYLTKHICMLIAFELRRISALIYAILRSS
jgi:hypothetical protein